jgi:hypothetical protein
MAKKPNAIYSEAQMVLDAAKEAELTVNQIRKAFKAWFKLAGEEFLNNKAVPLPGGAGYIYPTLTTSKARKQHSPLIGAEVEFLPKLKTMATFSDPWKELIHNDDRTKKLIETLLKDFIE